MVRFAENSLEAVIMDNKVGFDDLAILSYGRRIFELGSWMTSLSTTLTRNMVVTFWLVVEGVAETVKVFAI